jgi:hypothetical protein
MIRLALLYVPLLTLLYLTAAFLVTAFRIDKATHEENLQKLALTGEQAGRPQ